MLLIIKISSLIILYYIKGEFYVKIRLRTLIFLVFLSLCFSGFSYAKVVSKGKVSKGQLSKTFGDALLNMNFLRISSESGDVFMLTRDSKSRTRDLGWVLYNPVNNKVIKKGLCPFKFENKQVAVSPNAKYAAAFSRHPASLYILNIETGEWKNVYDNPPSDKSGLSIFELLGGSSTQDSPLVFVDDDTVASIFHDMKYAEGEKTTVDLVSVFYKISEGKLYKSLSYKTFIEGGEKAVKASGVHVDGALSLSGIKFLGFKSFIYVLKSGEKSFLIKAEEGREFKLIDSIAGDIEYLGNRTEDGAIVYNCIPTSQNKDNNYYRELKVYVNGKILTISSGRIFGALVSCYNRYILVNLSDSGRRYVIDLLKDGKTENLTSISKFMIFHLGDKKNILYLTDDREVQWFVFE